MHAIIFDCTHSHVSLCMPKSTHAVHVALLVSKWRSVQEDMHVYWNFDELLANSYPVTLDQ